MLYDKRSDGSFLTQWEVEFESELNPQQLKELNHLVQRYNSENPKWKAWTYRSLAEEKIHHWNDSFRHVSISTDDNRHLIFEFDCQPDRNRWWREWLALKFFPEVAAQVGDFKEPQIRQRGQSIRKQHEFRSSDFPVERAQTVTPGDGA